MGIVFHEKKRRRFERMVAASVEISCTKNQGRGGEGSGVIITPEGHILTAYHVIRGHRDILVTFCRLSGRGWTVLHAGTCHAEMLAKDTAADIALLKLRPTRKRLQPAKLGNSNSLKIGSPLYRVGNDADGQRLATGHVFGFARDSEEVPEFSFSNICDFGCSGGPVFDDRGRLVGLSLRGELGSAMPTDAQVIPINEIAARLLKPNDVPVEMHPEVAGPWK